MHECINIDFMENHTYKITTTATTAMTTTTTTTTRAITKTCLLLLPTIYIISFFCLDDFYHNIHLTIYPKSLPITNNHSKLLHHRIDRKRLNSIEDGLARARAAIQKRVRAQVRKYSSEEEGTFVTRGRIYRNPYGFHRSYMEMEKRFKIWIYKEGEPPFVHLAPMKNIYGVEGQFIGELESGVSKFVTYDANEAHAFFLPFSITSIVISLYRPLISYDRSPLQRVVQDYITMVIHKHPYWNRTHGGDHFMLSCHDWAPLVSIEPTFLFKNFVRALCNANTSEGFEPKRDVPIPEIKIPPSELNLPSLALPLHQRSIFAFFAGGAHGHVRKLLFEHWKPGDDVIQLHKYLRPDQNYFEMLGKSKFCLCPSGYEVASPRIVEAIHSECVPVIIKDNYSLPFSDVLDWKQFSVYVPIAKISEIKTILQRISDSEYMKLVDGVKRVKWHFTINRPAKRFDMIHMILHSIWLRRLNMKMM